VRIFLDERKKEKTRFKIKGQKFMNLINDKISPYLQKVVCHLIPHKLQTCSKVENGRNLLWQYQGPQKPAEHAHGYNERLKRAAKTEKRHRPIIARL